MLQSLLLSFASLTIVLSNGGTKARRLLSSMNTIKKPIMAEPIPFVGDELKLAIKREVEPSSGTIGSTSRLEKAKKCWKLAAMFKKYDQGLLSSIVEADGDKYWDEEQEQLEHARDELRGKIRDLIAELCANGTENENVARMMTELERLYRQLGDKSEGFEKQRFEDWADMIRRQRIVQDQRVQAP